MPIPRDLCIACSCDSSTFARDEEDSETSHALAHKPEPDSAAQLSSLALPVLVIPDLGVPTLQLAQSS